MRAVLLMFVLLSASPPQAYAQKDPATVRRAQEAVDRGDRFFDDKKFEEAIAEYTGALAILSHPDLVWNIARAHEELKRHTQALAFYERYRAMKISAADKAAAEAKITALEAAAARVETGRLIITTPSENARIQVGKTAVGKANRVDLPLKPGRYRIRVELADHTPFETVVRVRAGEATEVHAKLVREAQRAVIIVKVGAPGAKVSIDGGRPVAAGIPIPVAAGAHKIEVKAPGRALFTTLVDAAAGEKKTVAVELGPVIAPDSYPDWSGTYTLTGLFGGELVLAHEAATGRITGRLTAAGSRRLKRYRQKTCGGAEQLTWRAQWVAEITISGVNATLELSGGAISECSCASLCSVEAGAKASLFALPGREGLVGSSDVVVLRKPLVGKAASPWRIVKRGSLDGSWDVVLWDGRATPGDALTLKDGAGALRRRFTGRVSSWKRASCPGQDTFEQWVEYRVMFNGPNMLFAAGVEASCSCPGGCVVPRQLGGVPLRQLVLPRYLVGNRIIFRRKREK